MPAVESPNRTSTRTGRLRILLLGIVVILLLGLAFLPTRFRLHRYLPENHARSRAADIALAIDEYRRDQGNLPASLADLASASRPDGTPYLAEGSMDPWRRPFLYKIGTDGRQGWKFEVRSAGADGSAATSDDIVLTTVED
jgi:type II secretory pathway pseudopilin PulG